MGVAHVPLELGTGNQSGDRVDHDHIQSAGADQHVRDLEGLLPRVWLGDEQFIDVDADRLRIDGIEGVLGIDERSGPAVSLCFGDDMESEGGLAG